MLIIERKHVLWRINLCWKTTNTSICNILYLYKLFQNLYMYKRTFCCFDRYCIHKTLDCNSILLLFILMHIPCIKFCKAGNTMPKFRCDFTKLDIHEFLKRHSKSSTSKSWGRNENTPKGVLTISNRSYLACTLFWNLRMSFLLGGEPDV